MFDLQSHLNSNVKQAISQFCSELGKNSLLVQGAGGNVSWKENNILWIKASGTWLAEALQQDIFIPLDLPQVLDLIHKKIDNFIPTRLTQTQLRPSIETSLHALLPHKIVVHLHAIEILAIAVKNNAKMLFAKLLQDFNWAWIPYAKPGLDLTCAIATLKKTSTPDILILENHGLVIAGSSIEEISTLLNKVLNRCKNQLRSLAPLPNQHKLLQLSTEWQETPYQLPFHEKLHLLATDPINLAFVQHKWVMYPDHAIFLGATAILKNNKPARDFLLDHISYSPPCIIIPNQGIVVHQEISKGQYAMLDCYLEIISRLSHVDDAISLREEQIGELLNWDAEKYRQRINI